MQTERKVFEKLFSPDKVELESQKFELSVATDIEDRRNAGIAEIASSKKLYDKAFNGLFEYRNSLIRISQQASGVLYSIKQLSDKSKELGVEIAPKYLVLQKEAKTQEKDYLTKANAVDAVMKSIK